MNAKQIFKNTLDVALSEVLRKMGFQKFDNLRRILLSNGALEEDIADVPDQDIWLIPADQYDNIPKGYPVVDIFGNQKTFEGRKTCCKGDIRCGVLPIGILRPAEPEEPATECKFVTNKAFIKDGKFYAIGVPATESFMLQYAQQVVNGTESVELAPDVVKLSFRKIWRDGKYIISYRKNCSFRFDEDGTFLSIGSHYDDLRDLTQRFDKVEFIKPEPAIYSNMVRTASQYVHDNKNLWECSHQLG